MYYFKENMRNIFEIIIFLYLRFNLIHFYFLKSLNNVFIELINLDGFVNYFKQLSL